MKKFLMGVAAVGVSLTMANAAKADCGDISIAEWNWASGELMANVDKIILEEGYGCNVELVPGATTTTFASMNEKVSQISLVNCGLTLCANHYSQLWMKAVCIQ